MVSSSIQLFAIGPQDFHLTANPQITFFKTVFKRHTNFAIDTRRIYFSGSTPTFGSQDVLAKITKEGDLLGQIYLEAEIEATTDKIGAYTVNHFGNSLIKKVELEIGGYTIDTHHSQWLQIHDEITDKNLNNEQATSGLKGGLFTELNFTHDINQTKINTKNRLNGDCPLVFGGNINNENTDLSKGVGTYKKKIIIPLKFWFTKTSGMYLPICALYSHGVKLKFTFEELYKLIGNSLNLSNMTCSLKLYGEFIHLDSEEKRKFSQSNHEYIIEQTQLNNNGPYITTPTLNENSTSQLQKVDYELNFKHPIKYFVWAIVNDGSPSLTSSNNYGMGPCYFTSLCSNSIYGNDGNDGTVEILLDGVEREIELPMIYYTRLNHNKFSKTIPSLDRIGIYSFALNPLELEPSGSCNFSRINDKNIKIAFANNIASTILSKSLYFFGVNYNVLIITNGMASIRYE